MVKTYKKKTKDILEVINTVNELHVIEETRTEIQTEIDHLEINKTELQKNIDSQKAKIAILDKEV